MNDIFFYWGVFGIPTLLFTSLFALYLRERIIKRRLESKIASLETVLKNVCKQNHNLAKKFNELQAGSIGMSNKLAEFSNRFDDLSEKYNEFEVYDMDGRLYSRASKMAELGADVNELMSECNLPKAEAELLMSIKKAN